MDVDSVREIAERSDPNGEPRIDIIRPARTHGTRLGVFASSFNPPTIAHTELIRRSAKAFSLDETLALAGKTNADKRNYECPLEDRLAMLMLALAESHDTSIGLSTHGFYVDMLDALEQVYGKETRLHFIVGFDTFERVLDLEDRYTARYHRAFKNRMEAVEYLTTRSTLIVASRNGADVKSVESLLEQSGSVSPGSVKYLDFPSDLGELSATEVRARRRQGRPTTGLLPPLVENYIQERGLYI